jgi:hypothetical protein
MQKFTLYLGHPTYAVSVVLFSLLISGGAGSFLTRRHTIDIRVVSGYIIVMLCLYTIVFWGGTVDLFQYSWGERMVLAVGMTCALGIAMGMLFPLGILSVSRHHQESIPWMWAINGATSVLGSVIALLVAIHTGFTSAILLGAVSYGCLFLISLFHH